MGQMEVQVEEEKGWVMKTNEGTCGYGEDGE